MNMILTWISSNIYEIIAAILGILYVILATKQNIWCWATGILNVGMYIFIFFNSKLYGDMSLQIFYLFMSFYGWYEWKMGGENKKELNITKVSKKVIYATIAAMVVLSLLCGIILTYTDTDIPYLDGIATAFGIIGTWMTARKYLENWIVWIIGNTFCVGIYFYKGLYATVVFYAILAILAAYGYIKWKNDLLKLKTIDK